MDRVDFKTFLQICTDVLLQTTEWGRLKKAPAGEVGFHTFGDQVKKQILRDGVPFNMLVVGSSGLGKCHEVLAPFSNPSYVLTVRFGAKAKVF